jgi:hypothetical protein
MHKIVQYLGATSQFQALDDTIIKSKLIEFRRLTKPMPEYCAPLPYEHSQHFNIAGGTDTNVI